MPIVPKFNVELEIDLSGPDGNAFVVLGKVKETLRSAGASKDEIDEFFEEATCGDYEHLLAVCHEWVGLVEI